MNRFATRYWLQDWPLSVQLWACLSLAEGLTLAAILLYVLLLLRPEEPGQWYGLAALFPLLLIANLFAAKLAARRITEPLERLAGNLERIKGKNWSEPVLQTARRDEIGTIVNTLSQIQRNVVELNEDEEFFYQSVSHGLKTPIMVIQNCCAAYQDGIYGSEAIDIIMKESLAVEAGIRKSLLCLLLRSHAGQTERLPAGGAPGTDGGVPQAVSGQRAGYPAGGGRPGRPHGVGECGRAPDRL
ncbi:MAG: HAMP domain-containing protein [Flavonifractor plautii]